MSLCMHSLGMHACKPAQARKLSCNTQATVLGIGHIQGVTVSVIQAAVGSLRFLVCAGPSAMPGSFGAASTVAMRCDAATAEDAAAAVGAPARRHRRPSVSGILGSGGVLADAVLGSQTAGAPTPQHTRLLYRLAFFQP